MKLEIVDGYVVPNGDYKKMKKIRKGLVGKTFKSFNAVLDVLKIDEFVTVLGDTDSFGYGKGYKQVGKSAEGSWVQRNWATEY